MSREKLIKTLSISAKDPTGKMMRHQFYRRAVGPYDVHIKIRYAGVCHSDIHTAKGEWGPKKYPICVGHEIIGDVVCIGEKVTKFKVGDTAGVGCFTDSCRACDECKEGVENYCSGPGGMHGTYGSKRPESLHPGGMTMGGYSSDIVVDENYTIRIPKKMNVAAAAPLLCAGITCYAPFRDQGITKGHHLGVVGLGGLGHMAVKIGKALGCIITVFTRTKSKKELALKMGASKVVISTNKEEMIAARKGTMIMVGGVPVGAVPKGTFALIGRGLKLVGSCIGGIKGTQDMVDFCADHEILSDIEVIPATPEAVDVAWDRAIKSDVKFRFVIDIANTLK